MADLVVDLDGLARTGRRLDDALGVARQVHDRGAGVAGEVGDFGSPVLRNAVHDFLDEWSYGCGLIADDAQVLVDMLQQAVTTYRAADEAAAAAVPPAPVVVLGGTAQ